MLTERQINILQQEDLPTDYEKLDFVQQSSILAIEDLLCYLEKQYGEGFVYDGFVSSFNGPLDTLYAIRDGVRITATRSYQDNAFSYADDYLEILASPEYALALTEFLSARTDVNHCKVYSRITALESGEKESSILKRASAVSYIYCSEQLGQEAFTALIEEYAGWIKENAAGQDPITTFLLVKNEDFDGITEANHKDKYISLSFIDEKSCSLYKDGHVKVY